MKFKNYILIAAVALLLSSVQLLNVSQVSASENSTDSQGLILQGPPPFPPDDHPFPPPPWPPEPPSPPIPPTPPTPPEPHHPFHFPWYGPYDGHWDFSHWPYGWRWPPYVSSRLIIVEPPYQPPYRPVVYAPVINSFTANPSYIQPGQGIMLSWTTTNANTVSLSGIGSVPTSGTYNMSPGYTTTYTLSATNSAGSVSASTTVTVAPYISSYPSSSSYIAGTAVDPPASTNVVTGGLSTTSDNFGMLITLLGLLAVAAAVVIVLLVRRPAAAHAGGNGGRRAGYRASATRAASRIPGTTPADGPRLVLSNGEQISLSGSVGSLGRSDFESSVKGDEADLISRRHIRFDCEDGDCFIEDRGSTNGTKINGSNIEGKGRYLLRDGDRVELADVLTLTFKS